MTRSAVGAVGAQGAQALASFVLQILVVRALGLDGLGAFAILYGVMVLLAGVVTGFVGDSLVVLDRRDRTIRSALEQYALAISIVGAAAAGVAGWATGLLTPVEAALFALAAALFALEELMRRLLMANLRFWRVAAIDLVGFAAAMATLGVTAAVGDVSLDSFLVAIALGQAVAIVVGAALLPREERFVVSLARGGLTTVAGYGFWRACQQLLRPALLTAVRTLVTLALGLAMTGLLESARVYVAPAMLVVSGLTSFLFVSYAKEQETPLRRRLSRADRAVVALLGATAVIGIVFVVALPVAGPVLFGVTPPLVAVLGWLVYTASVSAVTPYGALAAVGGRQATVFAIRLADTALSCAAVAVALSLGAAVETVPLVLAAGSLAGGIALRVLVLRPPRGRLRA
jgi:O-antigen/teichoic acid export membrane protein